jgi:hypothetical protein
VGIITDQNGRGVPSGSGTMDGIYR